MNSIIINNYDKNLITSENGEQPQIEWGNNSV